MTMLDRMRRHKGWLKWSLAAVVLTFIFLYIPSFMGMYAKHFGALGIAVPHDVNQGGYQRYLGDTSVIGKGEILVWSPRAS